MTAPAIEVDIVLTRGERRIACRFAGEGGITALTGPSGAGKTSVIEAVAGLLRPAGGRIALAGTTLFDAAARIDLPPERRGCGVVFQDLRLFPHRTVRANLLYGAGRVAATNLPGLEETCAFLGIGDLLDRHPRTLSGGEAQRVAIGRALLSGPRVLLLDEPLSALDAERREGIVQVIERIRAELRLPIVLVTHDREDIARLADRTVPIGGTSGSN